MPAARSEDLLMTIDKAAALRVIDDYAAGGVVTAAPSPTDVFEPERLPVGDALIRYIADAREAYAGLRHCAGQLASLLLMDAIGAGGAIGDQPVLAAAEEELRAAQDSLRALAKPNTASAHADHLGQAARLFAEALKRLRDGRLRVGADRDLEIMKAGWGEMHLAARSLPGFQTVSLGQTCCAAHSEAYRREFQAN